VLSRTDCHHLVQACISTPMAMVHRPPWSLWRMSIYNHRDTLKVWLTDQVLTGLPRRLRILGMILRGNHLKTSNSILHRYLVRVLPRSFLGMDQLHRAYVCQVRQLLPWTQRRRLEGSAAQPPPCGPYQSRASVDP